MSQKNITIVKPVSNMFEFSGLLRRKEHWLVDVMELPPLFGKAFSFNAILVVYEREKGLLGGNIVRGNQTQDAWNALREVFTGKSADLGELPGGSIEPGLPSMITFVDVELFEMAKANIGQLGVECFCEEGNEELNVVLEHSRNAVRKIFSGDIPEKLQDEYDDFISEAEEAVFGVDDKELLEDFIGSEIPADDDIDSWKVAEEFLNDMITDVIFSEEEECDSDEALDKFFGDIDTDMIVYDECMIDDSYLIWLIFSYKEPGPFGSTIAEKWLQDNKLHGALRQMITSQLQLPPSLYRIVSLNKRKGEVELEDILLGGRVIVRAFQAVRYLKRGKIIPLRIYRAGEYNFMTLAGPMFDAKHRKAVVEYLSELNPEITHKNLLENAHIFGRLWGLYCEIV